MRRDGDCARTLDVLLVERSIEEILIRRFDRIEKFTHKPIDSYFIYV